MLELSMEALRILSHELWEYAEFYGCWSYGSDALGYADYPEYMRPVEGEWC